jgi:hypothetical protein
MRQQTISKRRTVHTANLASVLGLSVDLTSDLYRHIKRIETDGHRQAERYCNGDIDSDEQVKIEKKLRANLDATLKYAKSDVVRNIFFNWDPRGHFIKINDDYVRNNKLKIETDWGGYGIVCPDFNSGDL